ncbi:hypothetical protein ACOMHN_049757 [Nucella lapillus]
MKFSGFVVSGCIIGVCIVLLLISGTVARNGQRGGRSKKGPCNISSQELGHNPFKASCSKGVIASLRVLGHHGDRCQGLTADLFVQMNACFWKKKCTVSYRPGALNYMLKLYKGTMSECVVKQPEKFDISYECTSKKVKQLHVVRQFRGEEEEKVVRDREGVVLSHSDHPWLYRRHVTERANVTLEKPPGKRSRKLKYFLYTIRSLNLMHGDSLTVHWTTDNGLTNSTVFRPENDNIGAKQLVYDIPRAQRVVFSLSTSPYTNGGEGFVICFRWFKKVKKADTCRKLLVPQRCKRKPNKKTIKGKQT